MLENGTVFDTSYELGQLMFKIGDTESGIIQAWDHALMSMQINEKSRFLVDSKYAYGDQGSPPTIPPNANLIYDIELLKVHKASDVHDEREIISDIE